MALKGINVLEIAGLAPVPFCGMILSDFGANVIRVDRTNTKFSVDRFGRGKKSVAINFKKPEGLDVMKRLSNKCDVLIEPFRPGVMEKLGLGPKDLMKTNPGLIYARISGYGQLDGPKKHIAGHDINYLASSGLLSHFKRVDEKPLPPLNLLADMAGGGLSCAFGITLAILERFKSGKGQVVDTSMTHAASYVGSFVYAQKDMLFGLPPGQNLLDSGCPYYGTYETKDNKFVAIGAFEPQFFQALMKGLQIDPSKYSSQTDVRCWDEMKKDITDAIKEKTRDEWNEIFKNTDACLSPILSSVEAPHEPHNKETKSFFKSDDGNHYPTPAPVLSRTPGVASIAEQPKIAGNTCEMLLKFGFTENELQKLLKVEAVQDSNVTAKL